VQTNDQKRGIVKELLLKAADIKDLEVIGKDEDFNLRASTDAMTPPVQQQEEKPIQPPIQTNTVPTQQLPTPLPTPIFEQPAPTQVPYQDPAIISVTD
jgi:hypothetical protein